jgi:uncharacterized protein
MIDRKLTERLLLYTRNFPVVGIVGPRQVGKTTLVKHIIPEIDKETLYLDLESPEDYNKLADAELFLNGYENHTVIIDEVQRKSELFPILRSLIDRNREPGRFILLGSASPDLLRDGSESLAGRIVYLELNPFDIVELKGHKTVEQVWLKGGFPNAVLEVRDDISKQWMLSFIKTYIERDLPLLGLKAPIQSTEKLWMMLAHINGNLLNYSQISGSLGVSSNTVKSYVQFFEKSYLIRILPPIYTNTKKRLTKTPKLYFTDSGILHQLLRIHTLNDLFGHPGLGNSWESFVIQQVLNNLPEELDAHFYRTQDGSELDLIISKGQQIIAGVEIKISNAPKLSKGNSLAINTLNSPLNFIITPSSAEYPLRKNVQVCSLERFIDHHVPLMR